MPATPRSGPPCPAAADADCRRGAAAAAGLSDPEPGSPAAASGGMLPADLKPEQFKDIMKSVSMYAMEAGMSPDASTKLIKDMERVLDQKKYKAGMAIKRAESIKNFLEKNLSETEDIDFYNMAENPERNSNYMKRKGVPIDQAFNEDGILGSPNGRAIVIIEYQGNPIPATL